MKNFLLITLIFVLSVRIFSQINRGDVLINSFDPSVNGDYDKEFVVLVNRTDSPINLEGYEILCYDYEGHLQTHGYGYVYRFNVETILQPYQFLLIANISDVHGIIPDKLYDNYQIDFDGYLTLNKIHPVQESDFLDIVKYSRVDTSLYSFTGVPPNSGIDLSMPPVVHDSFGFRFPGSYLTRLGISGDFNSLTYTNYGMFGETVSDFSEISETNTDYIENSTSLPLPVELSSFSATLLLNDDVRVSWRTETEVMNYGFNIERSTMESNWFNIGFVAGHGNSNIPYQYSFVDNNPKDGNVVYYRLKQIDTDGNFEYSKAISVEFGKADKFNLSQNFPNPFNPTTTINYEIKEKSNVKIDIYDAIGEKVKSLVNEIKKPGIYSVKFDASDLPSGIYIYRVTAGGFTQTRKMIFLK